MVKKEKLKTASQISLQASPLSVPVFETYLQRLQNHIPLGSLGFRMSSEDSVIRQTLEKGMSFNIISKVAE